MNMETSNIYTENFWVEGKNLITTVILKFLNCI